MNINNLIAIVKEKLKKKIIMQDIKIEDKSFLHVGHKGNDKKKFHLKILINSKELSKMSRIQSNKKIYKILDTELKNYIHSIQILIS
mgnify:FL=1|tara:strand:- start:770 stop:1030 length:261 start_codon:yes stop_codon:yes gene_type:complete